MLDYIKSAGIAVAGLAMSPLTLQPANETILVACLITQIGLLGTALVGLINAYTAGVKQRNTQKTNGQKLDDIGERLGVPPPPEKS